MNLRALVVLGCFLVPVLAQDRMPPIPSDKLTPAQKKSLDLLAATPRGAGAGLTGGPFVPLLRSPELMNRLQAVGEYLRYNNSLPQHLVEMSIMMTARQWAQQYEWNAHEPLAVKAGLKAAVAEAIAAGRHPEGLTDEEDMVYNFTSELLQNHSVSDATYARMKTKFGEQGVVDTTSLIGYYGTIAGILNVARAPEQPGSNAPRLPMFPH